MLVDCDTCAVRGSACGECVLTVLWGLPGDDADAGDRSRPSSALRLDVHDRRALAVLADAGLAPPLRHAEAEPRVRRAG